MPMGACYLPCEPEQIPLPDGDLAHFISDTIDTLDLSTLHTCYTKDRPRNQRFHPAMTVKALTYGYGSGVFSPRKIACKLHEVVVFRMLAAGNSLVHRAIRKSRALHLKGLLVPFVQVVRLARKKRLVKLGTIGVDGTKVKANASRHKAMSCGRMVECEHESGVRIDALMGCAQAADVPERSELEAGIPAEIAWCEARRTVISIVRERLEQLQREADRRRGCSPDDENNLHDKGSGSRGIVTCASSAGSSRPRRRTLPFRMAGSCRAPVEGSMRATTCRRGSTRPRASSWLRSCPTAPAIRPSCGGRCARCVRTSGSRPIEY